MSLEHAAHILDESKETLQIIQNEVNLALEKELISLSLQNHVRRFLSDTITVLDYIGFAIFTEHCYKLVPSDNLEYIKKGVYFPIKFDNGSFDKYIHKYFVGLRENRNDLYKIFYNQQPCNADNKWLAHVHKLSNHAKHREFIPQKEVVSEREIIKVGDVNLISSGKGKIGKIVISDLSYNGSKVEYNSETGEKTSNIEIIERTAWIDLLFESLDIPVVKTLENIQRRTNIVLGEVTHLL